MTPHLPHVLDAALVVMATATTGAGSVLLATAPAEQSAELQLLLLPFMGALVASCSAIMLNPAPETRRITCGRGLIALLCGVCGPQVIGLAHPSLASLSLKPVMLVMLGAVISVLVYILSKPFFAQLYKRAEGVSERGVDLIEKRWGPPAKPRSEVAELTPPK